MKTTLRLLAALALPAALSLAGGALAGPMAADHPMSAAPMAAGHPMADSPMATDAMAPNAMAKPKPKMKHHARKAAPATGAMGSDAMAAPASAGAMAGH